MRYAIVQTEEDGYWFLESIDLNGASQWGRDRGLALLWADRQLAVIAADSLKAGVIEVRV